MKPPKVKVDFSRMADPAFIVYSGSVVTGLTNDSAALQNAPSFVPSLATITQQAGSFRDAYMAALKHDLDKIALRKECRTVLETSLYTLAHYLETAAINDPHLLDGTGFEVRRASGGSTSKGPVPAPDYLSLRHGPFPGMVIGKTNPVPGARSFEVHFTGGDPTIEANWSYQGVHPLSSAMEMTGFEGGALLSFRVRAICSNGYGPWSPVASLRVL